MNENLKIMEKTLDKLVHQWVIRPILNIYGIIIDTKDLWRW